MELQEDRKTRAAGIWVGHSAHVPLFSFSVVLAGFSASVLIQFAEKSLNA
jgi:hypothetical protein